MTSGRAEVPAQSRFAGGEGEFSLRVNGRPHTFVGDAATPLLWVLRDAMGLTGTKYGCGIARCGACTVVLTTAEGDLAIRSCVTPVERVATRPDHVTSITTIEGLGDGERLDPVQDAWLGANVPQCGYCQSGQIMATVALLRRTPHPTRDQIDAALAGNLCRCGTYPRIRQAIEQLAARR